jgi:hypothetical protein
MNIISLRSISIGIIVSLSSGALTDIFTFSPTDFARIFKKIYSKSKLGSVSTSILPNVQFSIIDLIALI